MSKDNVCWGRMNAAEQQAVENLLELAMRWPKSLWLFSAAGTLFVMKKNSQGERVMKASGGVDQKQVMFKVPIENDGGDW